MRNYMTGAAACAAVVLSAVGCGGPYRPQIAGDDSRQLAGLTLDVLDATYAMGGSARQIGLSVSADTADHLVVDVTAQDAAGLKALYFKLRYDPQRFRPAIVEPAAALGGRAETVSLSYPPAAGELDYGAVQTHPELRTGFTGSGVLAQISLRKAPATLRAVSAAGGAVTQPLADLAIDAANGLSWSYTCRGDYDQNGEVNIADLTPLSQHYREASPAGAGQPFPYDSALSQIDGDGNGEINTGDLSTIAQNYGVNVLGGFRVFHSADAADCPAEANAANGAGTTELTTAGLAVSGALNTGERQSQRLRFTSELGAARTTDYFWVRPFSRDNSAGAATVVREAAVDFPLALGAGTPASAGDGTLADPYVFISGETYGFTLLDSAGNDISTDAATQFGVAPAEAGVFAQNELALAGAYEGNFTVTASHNGIPLNPDSGVHGRSASSMDMSLRIEPDPADVDWAGVAGDGETESTAFIARTKDYNADYAMVFDLLAWRGPLAVPNADLDWDCFPPFLVADSASFTADATAGTFQVWELTSGYLFAQDPADATPAGTSNLLYVAVQSVPD